MTITNPALINTVAAMSIAVSSEVMIIRSLRMALPSMVGGHAKTMTRFGSPRGSFGLVRSDVFVAIRQMLAGFQAVKRETRQSSGGSFGTSGHDYFRRRVTILDSDSGHLHYLIQVYPDFGLVVDVTFRSSRGWLADEYGSSRDGALSLLI